ncbi:MAG: hypothetical protein R3B91_02630 [Planctomycetaceae bacterium]
MEERSRLITSSALQTDFFLNAAFVGPFVLPDEIVRVMMEDLTQPGQPLSLTFTSEFRKPRCASSKVCCTRSEASTLVCIQLSTCVLAMRAT